MSDSVDRVFSHALNTVNKIRTGSEKPPSATRLKLYGLYKQSMEGDVDGIMDRPEGNSEDARRAREKWDAWKEQNGLSRTEAKRRYISTLIETMHKYASPSPDARELVAELEFVWDQVKSNVPSSSSSSPLQTLNGAQGGNGPPSYPGLGASEAAAFSRPNLPADAPMRMLSPPSQNMEEDPDDTGVEEFVDAKDSQIAIQRDIINGEEDKDRPDPPRRSSSANPHNEKWRRRMETALVKLTAEVAALREQLESRRLFAHQRKFSIFGWTPWACWAAFKHITVDVIIFGAILLWLRRKNDRRLEGAARVMLGDAVAEARRVSNAQMANIGKIQLPKLPSRKN